MKIKELLSDKSKWTQKVNARDYKGFEVGALYEEATCFCLSGALVKCYTFSQRREIADKLHQALPCNFVDWNDAPEREFEEVKALIEKLNV